MQTSKLHILLAGNKAERDVRNLQLKYTPYFLILVFAGITACLRFYLIPEWGMVMHFLLFLLQCVIFTGFWQLIKFINKKLNAVYPFERGPFKRMMLQNAVTLLVIMPFATISTYLNWDMIPDFVNKEFMGVMVMVFLLVIFMFNFAFYSLHFFGSWQDSVREKASVEVQAATLEREKFNLQYHQLRNQVNPHYLFNMLTSLDGLVQTNPPLASEFIRHMAKVYRYVLQHKENEVVSIEEELEFIGHYINLLQVRYKEGLQVHMQVSEAAREKGVVMVTLQMLIDNAIKHNVVQSGSPLRVVIWDEGEYLIVHNNKQLRKQIESSNRQGLHQLKQLYGFLTEREVLIDDNGEHFTIKIPLL